MLLFYSPFCFCRIDSNDSIFTYDFSNLRPLSLFLFNLAKELSILLIFLKNQLLVCLFNLYVLEKAVASHSSTLAWKIPWMPSLRHNRLDVIRVLGFPFCPLTAQYSSHLSPQSTKSEQNSGKNKLMVDVTPGSLMKLQLCLTCHGQPPFPPLAPQALSHPY